MYQWYGIKRSEKIKVVAFNGSSRKNGNTCNSNKQSIGRT